MVKVMTAKASSNGTENSSVKYPELKARFFLGSKAMTVDDAKEMMGWTTDLDEMKKAKLRQDEPFLVLTEAEGETKVWCTRNTKNRPFSESWAKTLSQDLLNRHWADSRNGEEMTQNGESIILGRSGQVLSGQHRLMALIFADLRMKTDLAERAHWRKLWPEGKITMEALVVQGVSEDSSVTRTHDNVKPRTYSDVLFLDPKFFPKTSKVEREKIAKQVDHCVRMLWNRTGCKKDPFAPSRTHSEGLDFLDRHGRIRDAVKFIHDKNVAIPSSKNAVARYIAPGIAAAYLYLMGTSDTDPDKYDGADGDAKTEKKLSFGLWDKACEFWEKLATNHPDLKDVWVELANLADVTGIGDGSVAEKTAIIVKAWNLYSAGKRIKANLIGLGPDCYDKKPDGSRRLNDQGYPKMGGIDKGDLSVQNEKVIDDASVSPEELAKEAKKIRDENRKKMRDKKEEKPAKKGRKMIRLDEDEDDDKLEGEDEAEEDGELDDDDEESDDEDEVQSDDEESDEDNEDEEEAEDDADESDDDEDEESDVDDDEEPVVKKKPAKVGHKMKPVGGKRL